MLCISAPHPPTHPLAHLQVTFVPELEAEMAALRARAAQAEASAVQLEASLLVRHAANRVLCY